MKEETIKVILLQPGKLAKAIQFPKTDQTRPQDLTHSARSSEPSPTDPDPRSQDAVDRKSVV